MKKPHHFESPRYRWLISLGVVLFGLYGLCHSGWAQQADESQPVAEQVEKDIPSSEESRTPADQEDSQQEAVVSVASQPVVPPKSSVPAIEDAEEAAAPGFLERVDSAFATAVDYMASVLFYRLGADKEEYVVFSGSDIYVRPRGTDQPFKKLTPEGISSDETIAADDLEALYYRKKLIDAVPADDRYFRYGKLEGKEIEYISVKLPDVVVGGKTLSLSHGAKLVKEGDAYQLVGPMRGKLDPETSLTEEQAETLADAGWLKGGNDYIQSGKVGGAPVVVLWLALGAVYFTLYMRGVNFWGFSHAVEVVRGKYDNPEEDGEVTHFQALMSALSATVGLGNIAGVTIAMTQGGPGAFFWMILCGLFGMTSKFTECTLGQKYRTVKPDGTILGGPMGYLKTGLAEIGLGGLGRVLAFLFVVMCMLASFGGGNMFQINQSGSTLLEQVQSKERKIVAKLDSEIEAAASVKNKARVSELRQEKTKRQEEIDKFSQTFNVVYGIVMAILVGVVIIGGIKRIGAAAEKIVPTMCLMYIAACLWIIVTHLGEVPPLIGAIFTEAFSGDAIRGGLIGVLVIGVQRAAFSNEAGVGSAAIAHSAAKTEEPVREGAVALLGPFIDTIVVCSMTALVILITGAWDNPDWIIRDGLSGAALTSQAFEEEISWFPWLLSIAVVLFAFSTVISWSYYGERCWETLFGARSIMLYKVLCVMCVFVGAIANAGSVLDFSDMMILSMAFPNILGVALLSPKVRADLLDYWKRYQAGEFKTYK
ncbi:MAG: alanine:cation symporter family protein [Planctomycetaceae bacterium]|nr:alanine:cation symporter family protein [Planctomycetaceae bacterium]